MERTKASIKNYKFYGGKEFLERLKQVLGESTDIGLADRLDIPKGTIATWSKRNTTPYEISLRVHLATGVSLKWLLLGEGKPFEEKEHAEDNTVSIHKEEIINGVLTSSEEMKFDQSFLDHYNLAADNTKLIEAGTELLMVNAAETNPTSGRYLIDIDGSVSINQIQRLPGKKLAMSFDDSSIEVAEGDIKVLGRVVMTMAKA